MHSLTSCLVHCVFSTKERRKLITPDLEQRLWPYLGGIARENRMKALAVGGIEDHVHDAPFRPFDALCFKGSATYKRQLIQVGPRNFPRSTAIRVAGRLWRFHDWYFGSGFHNEVYQHSARASPNPNVPRRVRCIPETASD
jgi:hypothetical protein